MESLVKALEAELAILKRRYVDELQSMSSRILGEVFAERFSTHTPFNLSANCQTLQELASKIEQTLTILRTAKETQQ